MKQLITVAALLSLAACSGSGHDDLTQFVKESGANLRGKVEALPEMRPYQPFAYNAFELPDPFKPRKLKPSAGGGGGAQPDMTRPKEPLESFALETLKMVGVLKQKNAIYAVIKTPENTIYRVRTGNYLGQNFGKVVAITDTEVKLKEIVQDSTGDWAERDSTLTLQEQ
ncbi:pilus assembly protein PilP [Sulfuriferula sp. AH1]|uniref:pilus assembly protein PilP n=1 Tax=Sulfuriferula sp. AH1 TaxID=1985873 RepID=UPI000B3B7813|nr:pilus assembly protein PilP [Sulfuriferula sp. AH1]ARU30635.1 pilus assembly protein PilP [Sulfuriferula sp. AH1]